MLQQQKESYDNQNVLTLDRFNSLFFELVRLYNQHLDSLKESDCSEMDKSLTVFSGREFLEKKKKDFQKEFEPVLQDRWNLESATEMYDDKFFTEYRTVFVCFSTLYRIYDLIDKSEINEKDKREYSKIIRSQLSPQELFFMRYNAESFYGTNFRDYINRYNILKHLPSFELMEFKKWSKDLDQNEIESVNRLFFMVKKRIRSFHKSKQENYEECGILNDMIKLGRSIDSLYVKINQKSIKNFTGLKKLEMKEIVKLFKRFLKEMYIYSSFQMVNKKDDLKVSSCQDKDNTDYMVCKIKNANEQRLFLYESEKKLYAIK